MYIENWRILISIALISLLLTRSSPGASQEPDYAGSGVCKACHSEQYQQWQNSHHDLAMAEANDRSVKGDFNNVEFENFGITTRFYLEDGRYMVSTDGPDGSMQDYQVKYTFGVYPLQQYLIEFPGGRLQALDIGWDSRIKEQGGQRWFALHPGEKIDHKDVLHWTGPNLNWNYMCADCHSTNFEKKYDAESRTYSSSWSEINVACEACHGPGSQHVTWANSGVEQSDDKGLVVQFDERAGVSWPTNPVSKQPHRSTLKQSDKEIETCARCHSRRGQITDDWQPGRPFLDAFQPALLGEGLYYPDGQIQDEVYVWGSFLQSKMYQAGVTCSDCHDPHSGELRQPGDKVCAQCHRPAKYTKKQHHFHEPDSAGSNCIDCHMPATNYMVVDPRNDHSMRIPRPDISLATGSPNACTNCHTGQSNEWAAQQMSEWYGTSPSGFQKYAPALHAARSGAVGADQMLTELANDNAQPAIASATAIANLGAYQNQQSFESIRAVLKSTEPLKRLAALTALQSFGPQQRVLAFPLLSDPNKAIRIDAARLLAIMPAGDLPVAQKKMLDDGLAEYIAVQQFNAERPESQTNLGGLFAELGRYAEAEDAYREAIKLQSQFEPAYAGLAQLFTATQREEQALAVLDQGLAVRKDSAMLHHSRGLSLIRLRQTDKAIESLAKAARLGAEVARYAYVFAIALNSTGRTDMALAELAAAHRTHPQDREILMALVTINRDAGNLEAARAYAEKLIALNPDDPAVQGLLRQL